MPRRNVLAQWAVALGVCAAASVASPALSAETFILDEPLATRPNVKAKPNLMFILDDSGSMASEFMPDAMSDTGTYGYRSAQCNGVAYDPAVIYALPLDSTGQPLATPNFAAAWTNGFAQSGSTNLNGSSETITTINTTSSVATGTGNKNFVFTGSGFSATTFTVGETITLSASSGRSMTGTVSGWSATNFNTSGVKTLAVSVSSVTGSGSSSTWTATRFPGSYYYSYTGTQARMSWAYTSTGPVQNTFYNECLSTVGNSPGSGVFTKVTVKSTSADAQNYANWYAYYRTRSLLMRTAVGRAFKSLDDGYRVGFSTINSSTDVTTGDGFHPVDDFGTAQRASIYTKLYGAAASGGTPLRGALSKAGRYFAKGYAGQTDPVQYSCQRNYALLSTDGYWNSGGSVENANYGPRDLGGNLVANQDGTEERPMFDGTTTTAVTTRTLYIVGTLGSCRRSGVNRYAVTAQPQTFSGGAWSNSGAGEDSCVVGATVIVNGKTAADLAGKSEASAPTTTAVTTGGSSDTLADVAEYYYKTDLRTEGLGNCTSVASGTSQNVCSNILKPNGRDTAPHQHMTTFTIGLGVGGTLTYDRNYLTQTAGDYVNLTNGTVTWPVPTTTITGSSGDARNVDDLWHAAVNGRGQYYSAQNASQLGDAISGVVNTIMEENGSGAAASTSALELVAGDNNQVYRASYTTKTWTGDIQAFTLNGETGAVGSTPLWSAQAKLTSGTTPSARKIYYRQPTATTTLRAFNWTNLNADGYGASFSSLCSQTLVASQCASLTTAELTAANSGTNLVDYLRGVRTFETASTANSTTRGLYRPRTGVLGDIVNGAPVFVGKPPFTYADAGYAAFVSAKANRKRVVYAAANDGMLHAFSAATGTGSDGGAELWAYVPSAVLPNLYRLADASYESRHRYFVDGPPVVGDIKVGTTWKTILVGGLGKGGRSYYALDITDPASPLPLWEFTDTNLGLSFGNPIITKRADGTWVVAFASGYNNVSNGDGKGHLFVLNANTGARLLDISTTAGSTTDPSGLTKINSWVDDPSDNTSKRFYGGDLQGNLWRFDVDNLVAPNQGALQLAKFQLSATTPQPVTTMPEMAEVAGKPVIIVGTGRYLGTSDIEDTAQQSIYAVKDSLANTGVGDVRLSNKMVRQTFTLTGDIANITSNQVNWGTQDGWWVDLPHSGERVAADMALQFGTLSIDTAIPNGDACSSGGSSWRYFLNAANGNGFENVAAGGLWSANALIVGQSWVKLENGETRIIRQSSDGTIKTERPPGGGGSAGVPHRNSWRELAD
ncbi:PilC/PilY family type IV pilus protein [Variovorax sp. J2P1-59]|uniref:pilus assembly protein n=1 Tax=Variovorax flavidus TaxID=3053501 RepID=UPI002575C06F|nr:PilC/PilY family type IV pilus protein [Variovorax sp. J2P1-59]MDM0075145.1 PilC/PilY family type IV pilus protein [Variovorax sp. J2P1-59]